MSGETPNLGLPYPELTDTADVPRDIKALADELDALLGGGGGPGGGGTVPLVAAPVLVPGMAGQVRAGRQLAAADFTALGLSQPVGLWNLSGLANLGSDARPLVNLGSVPFGVGINGLATTAAVFAGSTGQALYIADSGAADPYRIRTGSWGCWFRTAKRGVFQTAVSKDNPNTAPTRGYMVAVDTTNVTKAFCATDAAGAFIDLNGVSDVADDRWHFAVASYDGTALRLYIDGVLEASLNGAGLGAINPTVTPLNVGARQADSGSAAVAPFYGRVDEAFVSADVPTEDQVRCLYATRLAHSLGTIPGAARLSVHRRRKGPALTVADFATQPVRLHNFTAGALTDQGSGGVALTPGGTVSVAGVDGTPGNAQSFAGGQSLPATDAGLPAGLTTRSYGCWFKTTSSAVQGVMGYGSGQGDLRLVLEPSLNAWSTVDNVSGGFVSDGQWHLAIVVEDNTAEAGVKRKLYLDGRLVGSSTIMNAITLAGANRFRIGARADGSAPFVGQIDGAFVCAHAMTHAEIMALHTKGTQDLGASPKNEGDHTERVDASAVLFVGDTLESQNLVDLGVTA